MENATSKELVDPLPFQHVVQVLHLLKTCQNTTLVQFLGKFYYKLPVDQSTLHRKYHLFIYFTHYSLLLLMYTAAQHNVAVKITQTISV